MKTSYENPEAGRRWQSMLNDPERIPFSFRYNGEVYTGFSPKHFELLDEECAQQRGKEIHRRRYRFDRALTFTLHLAFYPDYGAAEWTVWVENTGSENSGILESLEARLTIPGTRPVLKGILGDHVNQYCPYAYELSCYPVHLSCDSGRATHIQFPYFNLECGDGGVMLAIGWAGTWHADFETDGDVTTCTAGAVNQAKTYLKPGEKIRSALFVALPYSVRNEDYAANCWRSWFVRHNLPPEDASGKALAPFSTCMLAYDTGLPNSDGSISERYSTWRPSLEKMLAEDIRVDFRWFDAGWYVAPDGSSPVSDWWGTVGTWVLDPVKWPGSTFRESTDFAREHGMKTLMWFEPERVTNPEALAENFGYNPSWAIRREGCRVITNNIGDPECLKWTTERICRVLRENRVEMYREDNNGDPAALWAYLDEREGTQRAGITEYKFIMAHYKMWDDIIACTLSYGGCGFVDSCASGGGRNDLESLRRGIPMLRSDSDRTSTSLRLSITTAFNRWIPFCGANTKEKLSQLAPRGNSDPYIWRASYLPALNVDSQFVQDPDQDFGILRRGLAEWRQVNPYLLKDFYVHTPWHSEQDKSSFTAYSFYDSDSEKGVLLAFRMEDCPEDTLSIRLPYAETGKSYRITDQDSGVSKCFSGSDLKSRYTLTFDAPRTAHLLWIEAL